MKTWMTIGTLALVSGFALGDTVLENGGAPTFTNLPAEGGTGIYTGVNTGTPYWDNLSSDKGGAGNSCSGDCANIGDFLTATGSFTGGTNYNPNQYLSGSAVANANGVGTNNGPAAFNLVRNTNSLIMTLLGVNTSGVDAFGIYDTTHPSSLTPIFTTSTAPLTTANESGGYASYGFYITNAGQTWYSNTALDTTDGNHQHFVLFSFAADPNVFYLGISDWLYNNGGTGNGDYQDLVIRLNSDAVPEPATFGLMGLGLIGLGYARLRSRKNRA